MVNSSKGVKKSEMLKTLLKIKKKIPELNVHRVYLEDALKQNVPYVPYTRKTKL